MKKKIVSSLLAAGLVLSTAQVDGYATGSTSNESVTTDLTDKNTNKIGFESSLRVTGQTDNSITIKWDKPEQASVYSVYVNGNVVAEKVESTQYNIDELESANEYFISVSAFDENGKLLSESNEICAHTNLTVNSNYTLTKDIKAANIFINGGTFNLNGYTLTVDGDVWLANGTLNINKGKLYVNRDMNINDNLQQMAKTIYDYWFTQFNFPNENGMPYSSSNGQMVWNEIAKQKLPVGWSCSKMATVIENIRTGLNPRDNFKLGGGSIKYITVKNLRTNGALDFSGCDTIDETARRIVHCRSDVSVGDVLFASIAPLGRCYLVQETPQDWDINESVFSIRYNKETVTPEYLYMHLQSESFVKESTALN